MDLYTKDEDAVTWHTVIRELVGKEVIIFTQNQHAMGGILADFNGYVIKVTNAYDKNDKQATYYPVDKVISITEMNNEY